MPQSQPLRGSFSLNWEGSIPEGGECARTRPQDSSLPNCHDCNGSLTRETTYSRPDNNALSNNALRYYCPDCYVHLSQRCGNCRREPLISDMYSAPYGDLFCNQCFEASCIKCSECDRICFQSEVRWFGEDAFCGSCSASRDEWDIAEFVCENPTFDRIRTKRKFGVELETSHCDGHWELYNCTIWGCTYDCSISGKEFISPPLIGDQGLDEIHQFCGNMQNRDWAFDDHCGLHIHFDMEGMTDEQLFSIAYAYRITWSMWKCFVSRNRNSNDMCGSPRYTTDDIRNTKIWEYFVGARDRFEYVNWRAFFKHGTFEVRMGDPTFQGEEIELWLTAHALFLEYVKDLTFDQLDLAFGNGNSHTRPFSFGARFIWDKAIVDKLRKLSRRYHSSSIQTRLYPEHETFEA